MSLKDKLKKIGTIGAFAVAGLTSALGAGNNETESPAPTTPVSHTQKQHSETTIFTINGTKYLVPNAGDTLKSYQERLKTDAQQLDKETQKRAKEEHRVPNTTPVRSVADLCKKDLGAYVELAVKEIGFSKHCSEEDAYRALQDPNNPWMTFGKLVQKEKNNQNAALRQATQGR